jgi:hypothetical protein
MKIEKSTVEKIRITEIANLDPITVILEDFEPGKGKIIIECYGQSWSSFWPAMGGTITEFFCRCDEHYLAKNLSLIREYVDDYDALGDQVKRRICEMRRSKELESFDARELFDEANYIEDPYGDNAKLMEAVFGDEWRHDLNIPSKINPDYEYLTRIIKTVQQALKQRVNIDLNNLMPIDAIDSMLNMPRDRARAAIQSIIDDRNQFACSAEKMLENKKDSERLDWLDKKNSAMNERCGSNYGWKFDVNHNRIALTDHNLPKHTVREAIDAAMAKEQK